MNLVKLAQMFLEKSWLTLDGMKYKQRWATHYPPIKIIGLFFKFFRFDIPACCFFFLFTASPITCSMFSCFSRKTSLKDTSLLPNKQTFKFPSAVNLNRLHEEQKLSDIDVMNPNLPTKPGTLKAFEVSL